MNRPPTCGVTSSPHEGRVGRGPRRGASKVNAPPIPSPLLLPASGGEGENPALRFRGSRREHVRGILSSESGAEGEEHDHRSTFLATVCWIQPAGWYSLVTLCSSSVFSLPAVAGSRPMTNSCA